MFEMGSYYVARLGSDLQQSSCLLILLGANITGGLHHDILEIMFFVCFNSCVWVFCLKTCLCTT